MKFIKRKTTLFIWIFVFVSRLCNEHHRQRTSTLHTQAAVEYLINVVSLVSICALIPARPNSAHFQFLHFKHVCNVYLQHPSEAVSWVISWSPGVPPSLFSFTSSCSHFLTSPFLSSPFALLSLLPSGGYWTDLEQPDLNQQKIKPIMYVTMFTATTSCKWCPA